MRPFPACYTSGRGAPIFCSLYRYSTKKTGISVENEFQYTHNLNCFYSKFDRFDFSLQQGEVMNTVQENLEENTNINISEPEDKNRFKKTKFS